MKYILTENQLTDLLKKMVGSKKDESKIEDKTNKLSELEGKTVNFEEYEDGRKYANNVYEIKEATYEIIDTGKKIGSQITLRVEDIYNRNPDHIENLRKQGGKYKKILFNNKLLYVENTADGLKISDRNKITYKNEKLENYLNSVLDKFPLFSKEKETPVTDF